MVLIKSFHIIGLVLLFLCACQEKEINVQSNLIYVDDLGREIKLSNPPDRVISLAPSITEIIYFIGAEEKLVARTQACDYPKRVNNLPIISTYPLDIESIVKLDPDLVISVDGIVNPDQVKKLEELGAKVFFQKYETLGDIDSSIILLGSILEKEQKAIDLVDSLNKQLLDVYRFNEDPLKCLMITWSNPIFVYGKDTPFTDKIMYAGGANAMNEKLNSPYPEVSREYILKMNPDVIFGNSFQKMDTTFFTLYPELKEIRAYRKKQVFEVNDNLMSRPGPRYIESILELRSKLEKCE